MSMRLRFARRYPPSAGNPRSESRPRPASRGKASHADAFAAFLASSAFFASFAFLATAVFAVLVSSASAASATERTTAPVARGVEHPRRVNANPLHAEILKALSDEDGVRALAALRSPLLDLPPDERCTLEGRAYLLLGERGQARRRLESAVQARPTDADSLYWLGRAYQMTDAPVLAAAQFEKASWNGLDTAELHYRWAESLAEAGEILGEPIQRRLSSKEAANTKIGKFTRDGLVVGVGEAGAIVVSPPNSALYQIERALALEPQDVRSLLLCAELWARTNNHAQAVEYFQKAGKRLDASDKGAADAVRCHAGWAESLLAAGDLDGCLEHARAAADRDADKGAATDKLARAYSRAAQEAALRGDAPRQIRYLTLSTELRPAVDEMLSLADALAATQQRAAAKRCLQDALDHDPSVAQRSQIRQRLARLAAEP